MIGFNLNQRPRRVLGSHQHRVQANHLRRVLVSPRRHRGPDTDLLSRFTQLLDRRPIDIILALRYTRAHAEMGSADKGCDLCKTSS